jgi:hypothetical protein
MLMARASGSVSNMEHPIRLDRLLRFALPFEAHRFPCQISHQLVTAPVSAPFVGSICEQCQRPSCPAAFFDVLINQHVEH